MGGDSELGTDDQGYSYFNSHPRVGGDERTCRGTPYRVISIRTPAWGVTRASGAPSNPSHFNSHPRVGGDQALRCRRSGQAYFNSHPRVGGDGNVILNGVTVSISIRTPAWGVTCDVRRIACPCVISIRTPAWGVTAGKLMKHTAKRFQFAPPRGG